MFEKGNTFGKGRKKGSKNRATIAKEHVEAQVAAAALEAQIDDIEAKQMPLDFLLRAMRSRNLLWEQRFAAARSAAPYCHPQLQATAHVHLNPDGTPIAPVISVTIERGPPEPPRLSNKGPKQGDSVQ